MIMTMNIQYYSNQRSIELWLQRLSNLSTTEIFLSCSGSSPTLYISQRFWCEFTCVIIFSAAKVTSTNSLEAFCRLTNKWTSFWTWIAISVIQSLLRYIYTSSSAVAWMVNKWESSCFIEPTKQCQWCDFHYRIFYRAFLDFWLEEILWWF